MGSHISSLFSSTLPSCFLSYKGMLSCMQYRVQNKARPTMYALEPPTRLTSVFETLRREIVAGELRPNSPRIELDLAERFEVSRTPVRESLQRLATAGLVVPRKRGWAVREFTTEEIRQNAEVRLALEGYAAGL